MMKAYQRLLLLAILGATLGVAAAEAVAATELRQARRMLRQAEEHLALDEGEAAVALYEKVIQRFDGQALGFTAHLQLARYHYQGGRFETALEHYAKAARHGLGQRGTPNPDPAERSEALFHLGMCYVRSGKAERCFPAFRQVVEDAPGTEWANRAYFQIAEAHYAAGNYSQAIANYRLVGTSLAPEQRASGRFELGKPLSLRIADRDLLVLDGAAIEATVRTAAGDEETVELRPLRIGGETYAGELPTGLGAPRPGDGLLQAAGGERVVVRYRDRHTAGGELDVAREVELIGVAAGVPAFTDGAFQDPVTAVVLDQGRGVLDLRLIDLDRDAGPQAERVEVELVVERPLPPEEPAAGEAVVELQEERWEERVRTGATLTETRLERRAAVELGALGGGFTTGAADAGLRSGVFTASLPLVETGAAGDAPLRAAIGDRITLLYRDRDHLEGGSPRLRQAVVTVAPGSVSRLMMAGYHLEDADLKVRKELLQAETSLRIGQVYRDMGLETHAGRRFDAALEECRRVGRTDGVYDQELREETLYTLWRIFLAKGDLSGAAQACRTLQLEFPASDYIDDSLMDLGRAAAEAGDPKRAIQLFQQVAALPGGSPLAAEALFEVALVHAEGIEGVRGGERVVDEGARQRAIAAFRQVFTTFPDSAYASEALKRTGDLYFKERNVAQAIDFFERILREHPDAPFVADVLFSLARSHVLKEDWARADELVDRLQRQHPGYERMDTVRKLRAYIARQSGQGGIAP